MHRLALGLTLLAAAAPAARAELFASAPTFMASQAVVRCVLQNVGTTAVTISAPKVAAELAPINLPITSFCGASLAAGRSCLWEATPRTGGAHMCRVTVSSKANLRGQMEIAIGLQPLATVEMR